MTDAIVGVPLENLSSLIQRKIGLVLGVEDDIQKLSSMLTTIQAVLVDVEIEKFSNKQIANCLTKLKDAAYEANDAIEEWSTITQEPGYNDQGSHSTSGCSSLFGVTFRYKMAKKIKTIINRFDEIAWEIQFHFREGVAPDRFQVEESRETSSIINADVVYGRNGDKEKIIEVLRSNVSHGEDDLFVFSILGIGGLGKTTLAQLVYNDQRIVEHFDERIWVCVSEIFEAKRLTKMILESLTRQPYQIQDLDPMQRQIQENLSGKKFLVVLDDVWNAGSEKWFKLKSSLKCGAKGSSILVTTRQEAVSSIVSLFPLYPLTILSQEECWCLFKECAFGVGKEEIADLVEIGKGIVKKCGGVPLAVKTLGRLMCSERKVSKWLRVNDSKLWELPQEKGTDILPALRLSYNHLPSHLKQCFAFCSIYPKDYVMN